MATVQVRRFELDGDRELVPADPVPGVRLVPADDPAGREAPEIRRLHDLVAADHRWSSLGWSDRGWADYLGDPARWHRFVELDGRRVGWACCRRHSEDEVEIDSFGVLPEVIGRGVGGHALTLLVREIRSATPDDDGAPDDGGPGGSGLVWLTTTSWDHPHAAANYAARGFVERSPAHRIRPRRPARRRYPPRAPESDG